MDQQEEEASVSISVSVTVPSSLPPEEEEEEGQEEEDDMAAVKMALGPQVPLKDLLHLHKASKATCICIFLSFFLILVIDNRY